MAKMKTPKHNFPEGKAVICNEKITLKNYKKLFSKCLKANIRIGELFMRKPICKDYIYFGRDGYKICRYYKDNDSPKVSIGEFNSFFNHKEPKEKTYKITREQVLDIEKATYSFSGQMVRDEIKKLFPEVFETKLTVGKWYKSNNFNLVNYQGLEEEKCYGFGYVNTDRWHEKMTFLTEDHGANWIEATNQEVEEALIKEAVRRGFIGDKYIDISSLGFKNDDLITGGQLEYKDGWLNFGELRTAIFHKGVWGSVIPTLTIQEAEAKLKEIGVNAKIV